MPSINMIAPRRAEKQRVKRDIRRLTLVIGVEIAAVVILVGFMMARVYTTKARIVDLETQLQKLQPIVAKIESFEKATKELEPKVDLLNDAKMTTMRWYGLLDNLSTSMSNTTWITRLSTAQVAKDSEHATINLSGVSSNQELVGETMLRLHKNPDISNVDLHYTQKAIVGNKEAVEFEVAAVLKIVEPKKAEKGVSKGAVAKS